MAPRAQGIGTTELTEHTEESARVFGVFGGFVLFFRWNRRCVRWLSGHPMSAVAPADRRRDDARDRFQPLPQSASGSRSAIRSPKKMIVPPLSRLMHAVAGILPLATSFRTR